MKEYLSLIDIKLLIFFLILIALIVLVTIIVYLVNHRRMDIREISLKKAWVEGVFEKLSLNASKRLFRQQGKPIKTQKGEYRVDFQKAWDAEYKKLTQECCNGYKMCSDLCTYADENYENTRGCDLEKIIKGYMKYRRVSIQKNFDAFLSKCDELTPDEFFEIKPLQKGDIVGVYVIHNETRDMYYVGQAKKLFFRVNQHFTGHGNGDVYADYKYGDDFSIKIIKLTDSGYSDIDLLEKHMIEKYDAYNSGYNRTSGNR